MIEVLYLFYVNGRLLIQRNYRQIINKNDIVYYANKYIKTKKICENPIVELNNEFFVNVVLDDIVITVMTKSNSNICLIYNFIYKFIDILNYFFNNNISGLNVVNNFVLIYEICDEIVDYGYPQTLEINILKNRLINRAKNFNKTTKNFQSISDEFPCLNDLVEDIINDTQFRRVNGDTTGVIRNSNNINSSNNNNINSFNTNQHRNKDMYLRRSNNNNNDNMMQERNKLKSIGKETLIKIKNKIINNNTPINNFNFTTGNCTWRNNNIYYKKNEIYIDILEVLNVTINSNNLIHAHINGKVILNCFLSGMPVCELSTNNKINLFNDTRKNIKKKINSVMTVDHKKHISRSSKNEYRDRINNSNSSIDSSNSSSNTNSSNSLNNKNHKIKNKNNKKSSEKKENESEEIVLDNCIFHHCVTLPTHETKKIVTFTPPDGSFELMKYTITKNIKIPFYIIALYSPIINCLKGEKKISLKNLTNNKNTQANNKQTNKYEYTVTVRSNFENNMHASDVVLKIPIYKFSENVEIHYKSVGKAEFNDFENIVIWKIKKFLSNVEHTIKIHLTLENQENLYSNVKNRQKIYNVSKVVLHAHQINMNTVKFLNTYKLPITMSFQIPMFTSSGMYIRYLKIFEKSSYKVVKWIKYMTEAGIYQYK